MVTTQPLFVSQQPVLPNCTRYLEVEIEFNRDLISVSNTNRQVFNSKFSNVFTNEKLLAFRVYRKSTVPSTTTQRNNVDDAILNVCKLTIGFNGNMFLQDLPLGTLVSSELNGGFFWLQTPTTATVPDFKVIYTPAADFVLPALPNGSIGESFIFGIITTGSQY